MLKGFDPNQARRSARIKENQQLRSYSEIHKSPLKSSVQQSSSHYDSLFLSRWGKNLQSKSDKSVPWVNVGQGIFSVAVGQEHVIILNNKHECFAYGANNYGQLAQQTQIVARPTQISSFKEMKIVAVYCGAYHSFAQNHKGQILAFGLNMKGQLGVGSYSNIKKPTMVFSLLPGGSKNPKASFFVDAYEYKKRRRHMKSSLQISQLPIIANVMEKIQESCSQQSKSQGPTFLLQSDQMVTKIVCGPLHTAAVTNKSRLFVCGYGQKYALGIGQSKTINQFEQVKVKFGNGKIEAIQAGVNSLGLISSGKAYISGKINEKTYENFTIINIPEQATDIKLCQKSAIILTKKGDVYQLGQYFKESGDRVVCQFPRKIEKLQQIKSIFSGTGSYFAMADNRTFYGWGQNKFNQITGLNDQDLINYPKVLKIPIHYTENLSIISGNGTTFLLSGKPLETEFNKFKSQLSCSEIDVNSQDKRKNKATYSNICGTQQKIMLSQLGVQPRVFNCNMEIDFNELVFQSQISEGGYGIIYKGTWKQTTVAIKMFKIESQSAIKDFFSECAAMQALRHPNIVMFLGACTKPPNFAIVLQYCSKGSLWSTIQNLDYPLSWEDRRKFALDTAKGVYYLHTCNPPIIHRDLKSLNLLLDDSYRVKLADFGWTKGLQDYMTGKIGTYQWMAPQVIASHKYSEKADVFSYGIILWQIASRQPPFKHLQGIQVSIQVLNNDLRPTIPKKTPQCYSKLMKKCWERDPSKRPSFKQIIRDLQLMKF